MSKLRCGPASGRRQLFSEISTVIEMTSFFIDVDGLPDDVGGDFQLLFLFLCYGYLLYLGSDLISSGSELLLLVPSLADVVGSVVLPVLGAVPDGAIVLFSGLGDDAHLPASNPSHRRCDARLV